MKTEPEASIQSAIVAWRQLYDGESTPYPVSESAGRFDAISIRHPDFRDAPGNWPKIFHHRHPAKTSIVLIHGLKDSPAYLEGVAHRFAHAGANVVLPLLPGHGCKDPVTAMRDVSAQAWYSTVDRSVEIAAMLGEEVSIGGLSTGGALAIEKALRDPATIAGKIFLFSAALGLKPFQRSILSTAAVPRWADAWLARRPNDGIGGNPYKYTRTFLTGARQVHLVIESIWQRAAAEPELLRKLRQRTFVAHSEADQTIDLAAVRPFVRPDDRQQHHIIPASEAVAHADLVLAGAMHYETRWPDEPEPPRANPQFATMIRKALTFLDR